MTAWPLLPGEMSILAELLLADIPQDVPLFINAHIAVGIDNARQRSSAAWNHLLLEFRRSHLHGLRIGSTTEPTQLSSRLFQSSRI
jgi:hypothetical protein